MQYRVVLFATLSIIVLIAASIGASTTELVGRNTTLTSRAADGQTCRTSSDCGALTYCRRASGRVTSSKCVPQLLNGKRCSLDTDCVSGNCHKKRCKSKQPTGKKCYKNSDCTTSLCKEKRCVAFTAPVSTSLPITSALSTSSSPTQVSSSSFSSQSTNSQPTSSLFSTHSTSSASSSSSPATMPTVITLTPQDKAAFLAMGVRETTLNNFVADGFPLSTSEDNFAALRALYYKKAGPSTAVSKRDSSAIRERKLLERKQPTASNTTLSPFSTTQLQLRQNSDPCPNPVTNPSKCWNGRFKLQDRSKIPTNGCGPQSIPVNTISDIFQNVGNLAFTTFLNTVAPQFYEVCNEHDRCFGTCDSDYHQCQTDFFDQAMDVCKSTQYFAEVSARCIGQLLAYPLCVLGLETVCVYEAGFFPAAIENIGGCSIYQDSQKGACCEDCPDTSKFSNGVAADGAMVTGEKFECEWATCNQRCPNTDDHDKCQDCSSKCVDISTASYKACYDALSGCLQSCSTCGVGSFSVCADCVQGCRSGYDGCSISTTSEFCGCMGDCSGKCRSCQKGFLS